MKKLLIIITITTAWLTARADDIYLGHCDGNIIEGTVGNLSGTERTAAICLDKNTFPMYQGSKITGVRLGFGSNISNGSIFIRSALDGTDLYSQNIGSLYEGWQDIELDVPFTFPDEDIYIGYTCTGSTAIGISGEPDPNGCWVRVNGAWQQYADKITGSVCIQAVVDGTEFTLKDIEVRKIYPAIAGKNEPFTVTGSFRNNTNAAAETLALSYTIDGGSATATVATIDYVLPGEIGVFSFQATALSTIGNHTIEVTALEVNGAADEYAGNNTAVGNVSVIGKIVPRKVLLEYFTGQDCHNCPSAQTRWANILEGRDDAVWVSHHAGFMPDEYTVTESKAMTWFYASGNNSYAPASMLDRANLSGYGASTGGNPTPGPVFSPTDERLMEKLLDTRAEILAPVFIDLQRSYDASRSALAIRVAIGKVEGLDIKGQNPALNIFLIEDGLIGRQSGGSDNFVHDHVVRRFITPTWGDPLIFDEGGTVTKEYTCTLPPLWKPENMKIVAFVANYNADNVNNCEVYNAESVKLEGRDFEITGIDDTADSSFLPYPNPSDGRFVIACETTSQVTIVDLMGRIVYEAALRKGVNEVALSVPAGTYILKVTSDNKKVCTRKVIIK